MISRWKDVVISELSAALSSIDEKQYKDFLSMLLRNNQKVLCVGVGRVLISLKAWVKRLVHLDIDINYVGSETEPPVGSDDLLIVASASGESIFPVAIAKKAKVLGADVAYIGCSPDSTIAQIADICMILKGRTKFSGEDDKVSVQPMSTLFEQQLYLLCDIIALDIMEMNNWDESHIKDKHANLE